MITSFLLAAALGLNPNNKVISPGLGSRVVVRTQAFLVDSKPGQYLVDAFYNAKGNVPGEKIEGVRVSPRELFLRDSKAKRVLLSISTSTLKAGPLWICIMESPKGKVSSSSSQLTVLTRSCYQRILRMRKVRSSR
ncbi:hypothetical protein [Cyanobium usitatum]|jgi:hypothetical protein|uniref:hypothetical protein n=1 Tax=Cyanobium usitatum TaxID=2304190 RepID=UPI002AD3A841|nr:hypothetical protein [Cyanobium usitatum]